MTLYYYISASKQFLLEEEPVEEILRERLKFYQTNHLSVDFWLIQDTSLTKIPELSSLQNDFKRDIAAIISTNSCFIDWLKLRLQYVFIGSFETEESFIADTIQ